MKVTYYIITEADAITNSGYHPTGFDWGTVREITKQKPRHELTNAPAELQWDSEDDLYAAICDYDGGAACKTEHYLLLAWLNIIGALFDAGVSDGFLSPSTIQRRSKDWTPFHLAYLEHDPEKADEIKTEINSAIGDAFGSDAECRQRLSW